MTGQNSAAAKAAALRASARKACGGVSCLLRVRTPGMRRADSAADRWAHGAAGEDVTAGLLAPLAARGWAIRHDVRLRGRQFSIGNHG